MEKSDCLVEITYEDKLGNRVYPGTYIARREKAGDMETQVVSNNVTLIIFPISELEILSDEERERIEYKRALGLT